MNQTKEKPQRVKKPTLKDIAALARLSVPTISQILNNRANNYCSEATKAQVWKIAHKLNYQSNFGYQVMTGKKTNTVGLLCSQERVRQDEHITKLLLQLSSSLEGKGNASYMATLTADHSTADKQKIIDLINRGCSSFIFIGNPMEYQEVEEVLQTHGIHYIGLNNDMMQRSVQVDSSVAYEAYVKKFLSEGRTNFKILLNDSVNHREACGRVQGLFRAFPNENREILSQRYVSLLPDIPCHLHDFGDNIFQMGYEVTKALFEQDKTIQGLIFLSDLYALGATKYFTEIGVKVGSDIALCGYNNIDAIKFSTVPISTADHQCNKIKDVLIDNLAGIKPLRIVLEPEVILK